MRKLRDCLIFRKKPAKTGAAANSGATQQPLAKAPSGPEEDRFLTPAEVRARFSAPQDASGLRKNAAIETPKLPEKLADAKIINLEFVIPEQFEAYFPSENSEPKAARPASAPPVLVATQEPIPNLKPAAVTNAVRSERRAKRRAPISAPVRVRSVNLTRNSFDDVTTTLNVSRLGVLIASTNPVYRHSLDVMVTFPHSKAPNSVQAEQPGRVVHVSELADGRRSVAIALNVIHRQEDFIRSSGKTVHAELEPPKASIDRDPNSQRPLVLAVDAEEGVRESLKSYLTSEGYEVITVANGKEARGVLNHRTPSLLIAEFEGVGMPGYDICTDCKTNPRLQSMPVILTTSSAYPSDYASAHSLGAVVCIAKPYRQERLGHVVKLLAPPPKANENDAQPADSLRGRPGNGRLTKAATNRRGPYNRRS